MHEQRTTSPEKIKLSISNNPENFREIIEEAAEKFRLEIFRVSFDAKVDETQDPDGTRHITIKPVLLTKVPGFGHFEHGLFVLKDGERLAYAVTLESHGGLVYNEGDQTLYTNININSLREGLLPQDLKNPAELDKTQMSYSFEQNWAGGGWRDFVESEEATLRIAAALPGVHVLFEEEIVSRVNRVVPQ